MKVKFKDNMWIDGNDYIQGEVYRLAEHVAQSFIDAGYAEKYVVEKKALKVDKPYVPRRTTPSL